MPTLLDLRRLHVLDRLALALLAAGVACVALRLLPVAEAGATIGRILPLLLFLATVIVLAELTAEAEVFDVVATRLAITAGGNYVALFVFCVGFASLTTITLNLDTTAVLITPVMLALALRVGIAAVPLAMTTVWLANTASLLLPVSNLTNLLAADRIALDQLAFARRLFLPQVVAILATMAFLWVLYWRRSRRGADRYQPPERHVPRDRVLFTIAAGACLLFVTMTLLGLPLGLSSAGCAGLVVVAFALRDRAALRPRLLPWRLLVSVTGLFLVVETVGRHGLHDAVSALIGADGGTVGAFRAALVGAGLSNVLNNLPAYVAGEAAVPSTNHDQLLALLIGTNVGPIVTPWASLATLLWYERCQANGVEVPLRQFMLAGAGLAAAALAGTVVALLLTG